MTGPDAAVTHSRRAGWRGSWRIALRLARRDAGRSKARTTLVAAMVGVPVLLIVSLSTLLHTNNISPREGLATRMGQAQALITTTGDTRTPVIQNPHWSGWSSEPRDNAAPAPSRPWTLDQLRALTGGRLIPLWNGAPRLGSAGIALPISGVEVPLADPATHGMVQLRSGRLPQTPGEIAASAGLLGTTHWKVGTTLTDLDTKASLRIVGTYSTLGMASTDRNVLGLPGGLHDPAEDDVSNTTFLLVRSTPVDWAPSRG
jgi:putative ABC transport system permease protein